MSDRELEEMYDDILNDSYGEIKLGYLTFSPADIIKNCDPIAYRVGLSDFESTFETDET
jgi:hypothetical protein